MRLALLAALVLAATTGPRQGCGNGKPEPAYDPCAGKACGESCTACAPGDAGCFETAVVKACDPEHRCVPKVDGLCVRQPPRVTSCEGQACGVRCELPCPPGLPCGASPTDAVCDGLGHCLSPTSGATPPPPECLQPPPSWGCVGKACGDACGLCPPGTDPARCPVPTFAATACDAGLQCVTVGTFSCSQRPRAGARPAARRTAPARWTPGSAAARRAATAARRSPGST